VRVDRTDFLIDAQAKRRYPRYGSGSVHDHLERPEWYGMVYWYDIWVIVLEAKQLEQQYSPFRSLGSLEQAVDDFGQYEYITNRQQVR
jgi:hypothetical protein